MFRQPGDKARHKEWASRWRSAEYKSSTVGISYMALPAKFTEFYRQGIEGEMDKTKAVLVVSVKAAEFIQEELNEVGLTVLETKDVAECILAATNVNRQFFISESIKPA